MNEKEGNLFSDTEENLGEEQSINDDRSDGNSNDKSRTFATKEELLDHYSKKGKVINYEQFLLTTPMVGGGWDINIISVTKTGNNINRFKLTNDGYNCSYKHCLFTMTDIISKERFGLYSNKEYVKEFKEILQTINNTLEH